MSDAQDDDLPAAFGEVKTEGDGSDRGWSGGYSRYRISLDLGCFVPTAYSEIG